MEGWIYERGAGAQLGILERGTQGRNWIFWRERLRYIFNKKDVIIYGLCPSVKCVAPLFRVMSLAKV